jgi:hypothetical protein
MEILSRSEAEEAHPGRAASDSSFRTELKADPRAALESELGLQIPEEVSVYVHEESMSALSRRAG